MFRKDATACILKNDLEVLEEISYSFFKADPCVDPHCTILLNILSFAQMFALWRENQIFRLFQRLHDIFCL